VEVAAEEEGGAEALLQGMQQVEVWQALMLLVEEEVEVLVEGVGCLAWEL
jgi:hypothetical protein